MIKLRTTNYSNLPPALIHAGEMVYPEFVDESERLYGMAQSSGKPDFAIHPNTNPNGKFFWEKDIRNLKGCSKIPKKLRKLLERFLPRRPKKRFGKSIACKIPKQSKWAKLT